MLSWGPRLVWLTGIVLVAAAALGGSLEGAAAQAGRHEIRATVVDEEGRPVHNLLVGATPVWTPDGVRQGEFQPRYTVAGSVRFQLEAGVYRLDIRTARYGTCTVSGLENPEGRVKVVFAAEPGRESHIRMVVEAANALPQEGWVRCHFDDRPFHRIQGTVLGPDQEPLAGIGVRAVGHRHEPDPGPFTAPATPADGTFALEAPDGAYLLELFVERAGGECRLGYYDGSGRRIASTFVHHEDTDARRIAPAGRDVLGPVIRLRAPLSELCPRIQGLVTTELQPGWNLAGWTGPETGIAALFEALPPLEAATAWDAGSQSSREARRTEAGTTGSLTTLRPGMGLWLRLGGTAPVSWTRPLLAESALITLVDGWNLVGWSGQDAASPAEIFHSLGAEGGRAAIWDATAGQFRLVAADGPAWTRRVHEVRRGAALWLHTARAGWWLQPGWPAPVVVLLGDSHSHSLDQRRAHIAASQRFYAERYGVITSDVTFYFAADREALEDTYRQVRGREPAANLCGNYSAKVIFIATYRCYPVSHEYFHAIQDHLFGDDLFGGDRRGPTWIIEGSAFYTDFQQRYAQGTASYLPGTYFLWATWGPDVTLATVDRFSVNAAANLGYIAFEWLAAEVGEAAIIEYFALLPTSDTWEIAFQRAFGLTVDELYARMEAHRREVAPPFEWQASGTVRDREGQAVEGLRVWVIALVEGRWTSNYFVRTAADGAFAIAHAPGAGYALLVNYTCLNGTSHAIGAQGQEGFTADWRTVPLFTGADQDRTDIVITLPVTLEEIERDACAA